jgi:predicted phage terminase large subunit-like protein
MANKNSFHERMRNNMLIFGKVCMPQMFQVASAPAHYAIARELHDKTVQKLNIIAPRGSAKSSIVGCILPLHHICFDPGPKFIVLVSKTEGHAIRLLDTIKSVLDYSKPFHDYFGYHGMMNARVWKTTEIVTDQGDMIMTRGTGQQVVGLKHLNQRPTLIIVDDPEDMNNTKTDESMEYNFRWLMQSLYPSMDPRSGRMIIIGTPQHQRCIVETLKDAHGWKTLHYKSIQDDGTALWPEWWPIERLEGVRKEMESVGRVSMFYREFQCQVIGDEDQLFKEEYLRYYEGNLEFNRQKDAFLHITRLNDHYYEKPRITPINIFMGIDPASSVAKSADFSTIVPLGVDRAQNRYVLPYFRARVTPMKLAEHIMQYYDLYPARRTRIESTGYQEMLREYLRSQKHIPGLEIKEAPRTQKSVRLESMQPYFASGKMHIQPQMRELIDELLMYPRGKHDDLLDGLFYAMKGVFIPYHELPTEVKLSDHMKYFVGMATDEELEEKELTAPYRTEDLT